MSSDIGQPRLRRPYEPPQAFRIELQHEQAILSGCHTGATSNNAPFFGVRGCRPPGVACFGLPLTGCRKSGIGPGACGVNSGPRS